MLDPSDYTIITEICSFVLNYADGLIRFAASDAAGWFEFPVNYDVDTHVTYTPPLVSLANHRRGLVPWTIPIVGHLLAHVVVLSALQQQRRSNSHRSLEFEGIKSMELMRAESSTAGLS